MPHAHTAGQRDDQSSVRVFGQIDWGMGSPDRSTFRATLLILVSACSFGSLTTIVVFITRAGLPLLPAMFWRYLVAAIILFALISRNQRVAVTARQKWRLMVVGAVAQPAIKYLSLYALNYISVGSLGFLFYTYPAWLTILSAVRGDEKLSYIRLAALIVAMAGIAVMVGAPTVNSLHPTGVMLALGSALLYALYLPALSTAQRGIPAVTASFYLVLGVSTAFFLASVMSGELKVPDTIALWGYVGLLSLVCTVLALVALFAGLQILGPVGTSIVATIEPFFTAVLGAVFLAEMVTPATLIGGAMIAVAVMLLQVHGVRASVELKRAEAGGVS